MLPSHATDAPSDPTCSDEPARPGRPGAGADASVSVINFEFDAKSVKIGVGEKVTWSFVDDGHTTKSDAGQAERWNSGPAADPAGSSFEKTFTRPGRFTYICEPHQTFMKGTVTVGTDEHKKSQSKFSQSRRGSTVTYSFTLVEAARVQVNLQGEAKRSASSKRLGPGSTRSSSGTWSRASTTERRPSPTTSARSPL